jgi:hypothetical protein
VKQGLVAEIKVDTDINQNKSFPQTALLEWRCRVSIEDGGD